MVKLSSESDTGELFHTYVHPWQFVGKAYTYYMEEQIYQEGRGCYWYDEAHEGTVTEIRSLSEKPGENRIVLYYKWYKMGEKQYAVTVTCKDADTEEIICSKIQLFEQQAFNNRIFCEGYYAYDMDYRIIGQSGETYLYDIGNVKNVPVTKVDKNAIKNQIVLYYKKGEIKEGEAVAEAYYKASNSLLEKSFIAGLPVGKPINVQMRTSCNANGQEKEEIGRRYIILYGSHRAVPILNLFLQIQKKIQLSWSIS